MGLFGKLFGDNDVTKLENKTIKVSETPSITIPNAPSHATEQSLIELYAGIAFDKQADLYETIGNNAWNVYLDIGEISFGADLNFAVQALGTYSHQSNSWLWAWANDKADWPESVRVQSQQMKAFGEQNNIDIFVNGSFGAPISDLHLIGLIASGLFQSSAYYVADYGQGAMLFTIKTDKLIAAKNEHARILTVIPQMISAYDMHHQTAVTSYLVAKKYEISQDKNILTATKNSNSLIAEFDELGRLSNLKGKINS